MRTVSAPFRGRIENLPTCLRTCAHVEWCNQHGCVLANDWSRQRFDEVAAKQRKELSRELEHLLEREIKDA